MGRNGSGKEYFARPSQVGSQLYGAGGKVFVDDIRVRHVEVDRSLCRKVNRVPESI